MIDPKISKILNKEIQRQISNIQLIASENFASEEVRQLTGSIFTNKYAEGYPGRRYYNGCENMDAVELLAQDYIKQIFRCEHANVQPHSGAQANLAVMLAFLKPGDTILGMDLASGGHLSHGAKVNISGKWFNAISYITDINGWIDYDYLAVAAAKYNPKMIIAGASAYPRVIDWHQFRKIANSVGALLVADIAHYAGLIAGGVYPSPVGIADVVTSTTHKTLRGPRGGIILWNDSDYSRKINSAVFPGEQGGPLMHVIAAKAQCFYEALQPEFKIYALNVVNNARMMASAFLNRKINIVSGGTDSHIILIDLRNKKLSGKVVADTLDKDYNITVNMNGVPNDPLPFTQTSGIRIGTAAETTRGHDLMWFHDLADKISDVIDDLSETEGR